MARLTDLFIDERSGKLSSSRLWFNVGNAALTFGFLYSVTRYELGAELVFAYGAVVAGGNFATRYLKMKADKKGGGDASD